ncbi:hypothetical protein LTR95_014895 [Oleoguttula sp. CCFEE 5521]
MARHSRRLRILALLALTVAPLATAQITGNLPDLSTVTQTTASSSASSTETSATTEATTTNPSSTVPESSTSVFATTGSVNSGNGIRISNLPTIAGAGIPTLVIPYTAAAPFMQQSKLPEGTVFIVVGAVLAFMGACVLFWRGLVAWSINRSVRKSAMASIRGSEKDGRSWGGSTGYDAVAGKRGKHGNTSANRYHDAGSSMSLDALTSTGKPVHSRHAEPSAPGPEGLFFSPTAQARHTSWGGDPSRPVVELNHQRSSTYLPAGYYASPSSHAPTHTTLGGNAGDRTSLAPYARHAESPTSQNRASRQSRDMRDAGRGNRTSYMDVGARNSYLDPASGQGLGARTSNSDMGGSSRAPSAYFEDLLEEHGTGPRERF